MVFMLNQNESYLSDSFSRENDKKSFDPRHFFTLLFYNNIASDIQVTISKQYYNGCVAKFPTSVEFDLNLKIKLNSARKIVDVHKNAPSGNENEFPRKWKTKIKTSAISIWNGFHAKKKITRNLRSTL